MKYRYQYWAAVAVTVVLGMLAAINVAGGEALGIPSQGMAWLGVAGAGLGVLNGFLPKVNKPPSDERVGLD